MRTSLMGWSVVLLTTTALVACGDDTGGTGGGGGESSGTTTAATTTTGTTTGATTAATTTTGETTAVTTGETTAVTTGGEGGAGGQGGGGGESPCEPAEMTDIFFEGGSYIGLMSPGIGAAFDDYIVVQFNPTEHDVDLSTITDPATAEEYVFGGEDFDPENGYTGSFFFHTQGTISVTEAGWAISGVRIAEIDGETLAFIDGGRCFDVAAASGDNAVPLGWVCDPAYYNAGAGDGCDCSCGAYDPDCDIPDQTIYGCLAGQSCNMDAVCEGVPDAWTCDDAAYADGSTCDCDCGTPDPDCEDAGNPVEGCADGQSCGLDGACYAPEAICDDLTDNDADGRFDCDDMTSCKGVDASCNPGDGPIGSECTANSDCMASDNDPFCLSEELFDFQNGQCSEWCDLDNDDCPNGSVCLSLGVSRGACIPTCAVDADCRDDQTCEDVGGGTTVCLGTPVPPPVEWICEPSYYGTDDGCDCGCGAVDPDCGGASDTLCEFCFDPSCADLGDGSCDLAALVNDNNAVCVP